MKQMAHDEAGNEALGRSGNFIHQIIDGDLVDGTYEGRVVTRFPPEPNGYLHIGHAKSICLNFGLGEHYGSVCHLRFDDTNPSKEETEYVEAIKRDVKWFGFDWGEKLFFASDFFEDMFVLAVGLIEKGKAYVCSLNQEEIREQRGTLTEPGVQSPYRNRSVEENLELFRRMRAGEFADGEHVLRAKIDMSAANMLMRDPLLYRIRHVTHHRTGDAWCIYPMYDYAHCLEDALEGVTHSICTLEFENNRELYDWVLAHTQKGVRPKQIEFARLSLAHTVMSKRKLLELVEGGFVAGWDDPRMPTIAGLRRRGLRPEAIKAFCEMIGVAKANSMVDMEKLEYCIRDDLNHQAPRVMCVLRPLKVVITNFPEDRVEMLDASYWPHDVPRESSRDLPFSREIYIERDDFHDNPPKKWHRLAPGQEVRLRHAYIVKCDDVIRDEATGEVSELRCTYDHDTRSGQGSQRKVKGTIHWVSVTAGRRVTVNLYDRLFTVPKPDGDPDVDFKTYLNPDSLRVIENAVVEPSVLTEPEERRYQFERGGYFYRDPDADCSDGPVFNRIVPLRDSWGKQKKTEPAPVRSEEPAPPVARTDSDGTSNRQRPARRSKADLRDRARTASPGLAARHAHYLEVHGLAESDADRLTGDMDIVEFFEAALSRYNEPQTVSKWVVNEVLREVKGGSVDGLGFAGEQLGDLVRLVDTTMISGAAGKQVLSTMVREGGSPEEIVDALGLLQINDREQLVLVVDAVLMAHPEVVAKYRSGVTKLMGMFVGQVMKETGGKANPKLLKEILEEKLS
jgi:glutaminyl-tRNA synthetase